MTLYYPSLSGEYNQFRLIPRTADLTNPCTIGTLYVNSSNLLEYCHDNSGIGAWGSISDTWTQNGDDVYLDDITLKVGIGTKTPEFKLSLSGDAGIIASGTFGSGIVLPDGISAGSRLIWYPRKAAFRAGYVSGAQWDDANIEDYSVALGKDSTASGAYSVVGGGDTNTASGQYSNIIGGQTNTASGDYSAITGGTNNTAQGQYTTITGGRSNSSIADYGSILGGQNNSIVTPAAQYATVSGGVSNSVSTPYSNINGGNLNTINQLPGGGTSGYAVIGGGKNNQARDDYAVVSGGENNRVTGQYASIGGGNGGDISAQPAPGVFVPMVGNYSRVSGGQSNSPQGAYSTISGGKNNSGMGNYITIGGGLQNQANGDYSVVGAGERNIAGFNSVVMGGTDVWASGDYSFSAGKNMAAEGTSNRTFVWGYSDTPVQVVTPDAFIIAPGTIGGQPWNPKIGIRDTSPFSVLEINANGTTDDYINIKRNASGDVFIVKNNGYIGVNKATPTVATHAMQFGNANNAYLDAGGVWTNGSSRKFKENIAPLTSQTAEDTFEKLNPVTFNYKASRQTTAGFIAEDVPEIVALKDRQALSAMDIIAVLTKVSQDQEQAIKAQKEKIEKIKNEIKKLKKMQ